MLYVFVYSPCVCKKSILQSLFELLKVYFESFLTSSCYNVKPPTLYLTKVPVWFTIKVTRENMPFTLLARSDVLFNISSKTKIKG